MVSYLSVRRMRFASDSTNGEFVGLCGIGRVFYLAFYFQLVHMVAPSSLCSIVCAWFVGCYESHRCLSAVYVQVWVNGRGREGGIGRLASPLCDWYHRRCDSLVFLGVIGIFIYMRLLRRARFRSP
jgi:hypothetical protein